MSADIIELKGHLPIRTPIGHSIRIGDSAYKQLENLHAEGRLPARSVIVDASVARFQKEFIASLREGGAEIILDPKVAELSVRITPPAPYYRAKSSSAKDEGTL